MRKEDFLTKVSSAQVSDRAEIIMVDCRVELVYIRRLLGNGKLAWNHNHLAVAKKVEWRP